MQKAVTLRALCNLSVPTLPETLSDDGKEVDGGRPQSPAVGSNVILQQVGPVRSEVALVEGPPLGVRLRDQLAGLRLAQPAVLHHSPDADLWGGHQADVERFGKVAQEAAATSADEEHVA